MLTSSAKAKGRRLQQYVRDRLIAYYPYDLNKDDIRSTSMGAQGVDVQLSPKAQGLLPFAIECKAQEGYKKLYDAYEQAWENKQDGLYPIVVLRSNNKRALVILDFDDFIEVQK